MDLERRPLSPLLRHPLAVAFWVVVLVGTLRLIPLLQPALFVGLLGVLLAILFAFPTRLFCRVMPRGLAVILTLLLFLGLIVGVGFLIVPPLSRQTTQLLEQVPRAADQLQGWLHRVEDRTNLPVATDGAVADSVRKRATALADSLMSHTLPAAFSAVSLAFGFVLVVILAAFLAYQPQSYQVALRSLVPREQEPVFDEVWRRLGRGLSHWVAGMLAGMALMGAFTALGTWAIGLESWPMLGIITFLATSVPYLGAIASAVPGLVLGLAKSPAYLFYALLVYVGVHVLEGYVVQPLVMRRAVELRPAFLLFWQVLMGAAFGVAGIVVATPVLVCAKVIGGYLWVERRLGKAGPEV